MQARLFPQHFAARGIPAGAPLDTDLLMEAEREHHFREVALGHLNIAAHAIRAGARLDFALLEEAQQEHFFRTAALHQLNATPYEVHESKMRMHAIEFEYSAERYYFGQHGAIATAVQQQLMPTNHMLGMIYTQLQLIDRRLRAVEGQVQVTNNRLRVIEGRVQCIIGDTTDIRNMQRRAVNHRVVQPGGALRALTPLVTRYGQYGNGIAGMEPFHPPAGVHLGGEIPSPPFAATSAAIDMMSMQQIHELAVYANDDFGVMQGDTLQRGRKNVRMFVAGP